MNMRLALLVSALCGFLALSYEILWFRIYGFATGGAPGSFGVVLGVYLLGIAFGSLGVRRFCDDKAAHGDPARLLIPAWLVLSATLGGWLLLPFVADLVRIHMYTGSLPGVAIVAGLRDYIEGNPDFDTRNTNPNAEGSATLLLPMTPVPMPVPPVHIRTPILITSPTHSIEEDDDDIESTTPLVERKSIHRVVPSPPPSIHSFLSKLTHAHPPHPPPPPPHDFDEDEELDVYVYVPPPTTATTFVYQTCCPSISTQAPTPAFDPLWVGPATAANYGLAVRENKHRNDCAQWISLYEHICTGR